MAEKMLVEERMTRHLETIDPEDYLVAAQAKMRQGNFQRLPVVQDGRVVGIITDRDLREHRGILERTKVGAVMTQNVITVRPEVTLEKAARLLLTHKVGGLPVMDGDHLAGMITRSDILQAFLDLVGASEEDSFRIDFVMAKAMTSPSPREPLRMRAGKFSADSEPFGKAGTKIAFPTCTFAAGTRTASLTRLPRRATKSWACTCESVERERAARRCAFARE